MLMTVIAMLPTANPNSAGVYSPARPQRAAAFAETGSCGDTGITRGSTHLPLPSLGTPIGESLDNGLGVGSGALLWIF